jgi:hypothetical protein
VLVFIHEWTESLKALRRGDRCLVWITGVQNNKIGNQVWRGPSPV